MERRTKGSLTYVSTFLLVSLTAVILRLALPPPAALTANVTHQICIALDGSGSIRSSDFTTMKEGLAAAVEDSSTMPQNGSTELTLVQFSSGVETIAGPTVIDSATTASAVASAVRAARQMNGSTNTALAIDTCRDKIIRSATFGTASKQMINISTDGNPDSQTAAVKARDNAVAAGIDEVDLEAIGSLPSMDKMLEMAYPRPGYVAPPFRGGGFVIKVATFADYAAAMREKVRQVVPPTPAPNRPPNAVIEYITPSPAVQAQTVYFGGRGTDPDGDSIVAYSWRSSLQGQLDSSASFTKSDLSVGTHTIYFKVQDSRGASSQEASQELKVVPSGASLGWTRQISGSSNSLFSVFFVDARQGWAVGLDGTILNTTDGGTTWSTQPSGTSSWLFSVFFIDAQRGWAVGGVAATTILNTTDGGATWIIQRPDSNGLYSVFLADARTGWAVGWGGDIFKTTNGGTTWARQDSGTYSSLNSVFFVDARRGWAVGTDGTIQYTRDGGTTWSPQASDTSNDLYSVFFVDAQTGWAAGDNGTILKTANGGATWITQTSSTSNHLWSVSFVDAQRGWAVGKAGTILSTTNGGLTWTSQSSGASDDLLCVFFVDAWTGWAVGRRGTILRYGPAASGNQPPSAAIDSISPNPAAQGQTVSFSGRGTDPDGDAIVGYNWRSNKQGNLSTGASFTKADLSVGTHTIYFKVQDSRELWSAEVSQTLAVYDPAYSSALAEKRGRIDSLSALKYMYISEVTVGSYDESAAQSYVNAHSDPASATAADLSKLLRLGYAEYGLDSLAYQEISLLARTSQAKAEALITWFGLGQIALSIADKGKCKLTPKDAILNKAFIQNYEVGWTAVEKLVDYILQYSKADERTKRLMRLTFDAAVSTGATGAKGGIEELAKEAFRATLVVGGISQHLAQWYIPSTQAVIAESVAKANDVSGAGVKGTDNEAHNAVEALVGRNQKETNEANTNADGYLGRAGLREVFNSIYDFLFVCLPPGKKEKAISLAGSFALRLGTQYDLSKAESIATKRAVALVNQAKYAGLLAFDPAASNPYGSSSFAAAEVTPLGPKAPRQAHLASLSARVQDVATDYISLLDQVNAAVQTGDVDAAVGLADALFDAGDSLLERFRASDAAVEAVADRASSSKANFDSQYTALAAGASNFYAMLAQLNSSLAAFIVSPTAADKRQAVASAASNLKDAITSYQQASTVVQQTVSDIAAPAALLVSSVSAPEAISVTNTLTVEVEVTNVGGTTAVGATLAVTSANDLLSTSSSSSLELGDLPPMASRKVSVQVRASGQRGTATLIARPQAPSTVTQSRSFSIPLVFPELRRVYIPLVQKNWRIAPERNFGYGMAVTSVRDDPLGATSTSLRKVKDAGFGLVLAYVDWSKIEPTKGYYDWRLVEDIVKQTRAYGLKVVLRIHRPPAWANGGASPKAAPLRGEDLADFVNTLGARLGGDIYGLIILNEPNLASEWGGPPDPAAYMRLLKTVYSRAKQSWPTAFMKIISAPLAPTNDVGSNAMDDRTYLRRLYEEGLKDYSDAVGVNALGFAYHPDDTSDTNAFNFSRVEQLRQIMVAFGDANKKVWALEVGWLLNTTQDLGTYNWMKVSESQQAEYLKRAYQKAYDEWPWMEAMFVWNLDFSVYAPRSSDSPEMPWFSLLNGDGSERQAYRALKEMWKAPSLYGVSVPLLEQPLRRATLVK